ncbi:Exocyst complex component 3 [Dirofilaria immitis]|nr:Exocyst complex component 3 [Dirofilaria immitis]
MRFLLFWVGSGLGWCLGLCVRLYNMYNGIGLQTARGSGTNGYVQANMANLLLSKKRVAYNSEADIKRAEAEINKQPNKELLEHNRKRHIELKCADFEMLMENKGFDEAEIQKKVSEYRKLLQSQVASGELDIDAEMDNRDTHVRAKAAIENRGRMRAALGIKDDFVDGTSFENLNKNADLKADEVEEDDCKKRKKGGRNEKSKKIRKTASSSSSSSTSSSAESSSDDSSESSSDSDDSSTNSVGESSDSNSSEVLKAETRKKVKDMPRNKGNSKHSHRHEVRYSCDRHNDDDDFSDREKRHRRDSSDYYDRSCRNQYHNNDHDYRRFRRSYDCDDGGRRDRYPRRYDHRHRRSDVESDRRRKHDRIEKKNRHEEEKRSHRKHHDASDSDTDRKHKYNMADQSDDEDQKQLRQHNSNLEKKKPMEGVQIEVDVQESKERIHNPNERKVERSSDRKRSHCSSSEIRCNSEKRYRHDTTESEDGTRSSSSSNDEFLHHSGSARSSTTTSDDGAAENILKEIQAKYAHSSEDNLEKSDCNKSLESRDQIEILMMEATMDDMDQEEMGRDPQKLGSNYDDSDADKCRHRHSDNFHKHKRDVKSSESKFRRSESHESKHHGHRRSSGRFHRSSRRKSLSNDSLRKSHHSKHQIKRGRSPSRHHHKYSSESRKSTSHHRIRKFTRVSSRKRSYSPKNSKAKRSIKRKDSESVESTSEEKERIKRRRLDSSTSNDEEDTEDSNGKRSHRSSSESSSSSSSSSQSSVARTRHHSNDYGKKRHHQRSSMLREPIDESD